MQINIKIEFDGRVYDIEGDTETGDSWDISPPVQWFEDQVKIDSLIDGLTNMADSLKD